MRFFYALCSLSLLSGPAFAKELGKEEVSKVSLAKRQDSNRDSCSEGPPNVAFLPPDGALGKKTNFAYNIPARVHPEDAYGPFFSVSFIYWNVGQDYMDIGREALFAAGGSTPAADGGVAVPDFDWEPGFKVSFGYGSDYDDWVVEGIYTYLHAKNTYNTGTARASYGNGNPILVPNEWLINASTTQQQQAGTMSSTWDMDLDMLDVVISRPFYEGRRITISPNMGLRAIWLDQQYDVTAARAEAPNAAPLTSNNVSKGWGLGPHFLLKANCIFPMGFRLEGQLGSSMLYMRYTTRTHAESFPSGVTGGTDLPISGHYKDEGYLRPIGEAGLGFGWGAYLYGSYHIDFAARYDFTLLWEQNVMRELVGYLANNTVGYSNPIGNLNLHGLTLTGRFDF